MLYVEGLSHNALLNVNARIDYGTTNITFFSQIQVINPNRFHQYQSFERQRQKRNENEANPGFFSLEFDLNKKMRFYVFETWRGVCLVR